MMGILAVGALFGSLGPSLRSQLTRIISTYIGPWRVPDVPRCYLTVMKVFRKPTDFRKCEKVYILLLNIGKQNISLNTYLSMKCIFTNLKSFFSKCPISCFKSNSQLCPMPTTSNPSVIEAPTTLHWAIARLKWSELGTS